MAKISIWNIGRANELIDSAAAVLSPALEKANIKTITVDGKPVAAATAPLADQISALIAVSATNSGSQNENELMVTNSTLAAQLEKITVELATANATVGTLQTAQTALETRASTAEAAVQTLTAEKGQLQVQLDAAKNEFTRVSREQSTFNTELSRACIAIGCLQLTDANGAALKLNATEEQKLEAANKLTASEKLKAYQGGLNLAVANMGLNVSSIPGAPLKFAAKVGGKLAEYNAMTNSAEKTAFYRQHKAEIDQEHREQLAAGK